MTKVNVGGGDDNYNLDDQNGDSWLHLPFQLNEVSGQLEKAAHSEEKLEVKPRQIFGTQFVQWTVLCPRF